MTASDAAAKLALLQKRCEAIAHPARRQILLTIHLRGGAVTAGAIAGRFAHAWPTTTRHLRVLEDAGMLVSERCGRERHYRLVTDALEPIREWMDWFGPSSLYAKLGDPFASPTHGPAADDRSRPSEVIEEAIPAALDRAVKTPRATKKKRRGLRANR